MSTLQVTNLHIGSTGSNRIQFDSSNVNIYQSDQVLLAANSSMISLVGTSKTKNVSTTVLDTHSVGDIVTQYANDSIPTGYVATNTALLKASYTALSAYVGDVDPSDIMWLNRTANSLSQLYGITYGNGIFVAVSTSSTNNQVVTTSTDGFTWTRRATAAANTYNGAAYGNGVYVIVGGSPFGSIQSSTDGITWTNRTTANTNRQNAVAYGNGVFVSVGVSGSIQTSTDGTTWSNRTTANTGAQYGVAYGNGVFVSVGGAGAIQSSTNGTTWTNRTTANTNTQNAVAYGNGVFVSVGQNGSIQTSTDGTTWSNRTSTFPTSPEVTCVGYGNGVFILAGYYGGATTSLIKRSTDGITWEDRSLPSDITYPTGIAYGSGTFAISSRDVKITTNMASTEFAVIDPSVLPDELEFIVRAT